MEIILKFNYKEEEEKETRLERENHSTNNLREEKEHWTLRLTKIYVINSEINTHIQVQLQLYININYKW